MLSIRRTYGRRIIIGCAALALLLGSASLSWFLLSQNDNRQASENTQTQEQPSSQERAPESAQKDAFNIDQFSTTEPSSLWVVVNKQHPLMPLDYAPDDLIFAHGVYYSSRLHSSLLALMENASADGVTFAVNNAYRSFARQQTLYNSYVAQYGQATADTISARPGHSEHQTGLAVDLNSTTQPACNLSPCFAETEEGQWLAENAWKYGFIVRYPPGKEEITGYTAEPWHLRYVGRDLAAEMRERNITTLEEFFDISGGTMYAGD